jgi:hypothetical protein
MADLLTLAALNKITSQISYVQGKDGKDGKDGAAGKDGKNGVSGKDGARGDRGLAGKDGFLGLNGAKGIDGKDGKDGDNGEDGVSVSSVSQAADGDLVFLLSDGNEKVIELPFDLSPNSASGVHVYNRGESSGSGGATLASAVTIDDSSFDVISATDVQAFAENVDHSLLKARGSGVTSSYVSSVSVGGTTFNQPAVFGEINSDEGYSDIHYTGGTGITVSTLSSPSTYVYIDNTGSLQQQTSTPTRQDWSRKVFTMRIGVDTDTNLILGFEYLNNPIGHYANSMRDLYSYLLAQGVPFKKDQVVTGRTTDLGFDVSAGSLMEFGGTGNIYDPNIRSFDSVDNASYTLTSRTEFVSTETNLVKFWDNAGTITALGSTTLVGHRLYRFSNGNFAMQYGQGNYANLVLAKAGAVLEDYVLNPQLKNATFMGWWFIESIATNTGNTGATTTTDFVEYTIGIQGGSSSGLSGAVLRGNNGSDFLDIDATRTNFGLNTTANQTDSTDKRFVTDAEKAAIPSVYSFNRVTGTSTQAVTSTATAITWSSSSDSFGSNVTYSGASATRLTAATDGVYKIGGYFAVNTNDQRPQAAVQIYVNGSAFGGIRTSSYIRNAGSSWDYWILELSGTPINLSATDYVEIYIGLVNGASYSFSGSTTVTVDRSKSQLFVERVA